MQPLAHLSQTLSALLRLLAEQQQSPTSVIQSVSPQLEDKLTHWLENNQTKPRPFIIALAGGSGSGKSMLRDLLVDTLSPVMPVSAFSQDNYYRDFHADFPDWTLTAFYDHIDLDDPTHFRLAHLAEDLARLKTLSLGDTLSIPQLVYGTPDTKPTIIPGGLHICVTPVIITEGIHAFYTPALRAQYDLSIFVDIDEATRQQRWQHRNQLENRGTTANMWQTTVHCLNAHILPNRAHADIVLNNGVAEERIYPFIKTIIQKMSLSVEN